MATVDGSQKTNLFSYLDEYLTLEALNLENYNVLCGQKQDIAKDILRLFAEKLRDHRELESRWGVIQETHLKYFRGKDFVSFMKTQLKDFPEAGGSSTVEGIANALLKECLLVRCDRVVKTGQPVENLPTWPKHLEISPNQVFSETDAFFAWTFEKSRPLWQKIISFLLPMLMTLELCLFPHFRYQCKLLVLYYPARLVLLILCLLSCELETVIKDFILFTYFLFSFQKFMYCYVIVGVLLMFWLDYSDEHDEAARERLREEILNKNNDSMTESKAKSEDEDIKTQPSTTEEEVIKTQPDDKDLKFPKEDQVFWEEVVQDEIYGHHSYHPHMETKRGI